MDYKDIKEEENRVIISGVKNFDLKHIFECGQCFRWNRLENGNYIGVAFERVIELEQKDDTVTIYNSNLADFKNIWLDYFDLNRDYSKIKEILSKDKILKESVEFGRGIRILNQEPFEMLISFITSANNQIPRIKKIIETISKNHGKEIVYKGISYYTFPSSSELEKASLEELTSFGLGFRDKYIFNTVKAVCNANRAYLKRESGEVLTEEEIKHLDFHLESIVNMDHNLCHKSLQTYSGVGPKVADCIMLFSMKKQEAFPVDVWVKKAMVHFYNAPEASLVKIRKFGQDTFGELAGFAQQYLFYNARENKIKID